MKTNLKERLSTMFERTNQGECQLEEAIDADLNDKKLTKQIRKYIKNVFIEVAKKGCNCITFTYDEDTTLDYMIYQGQYVKITTMHYQDFARKYGLCVDYSYENGEKTEVYFHLSKSCRKEKNFKRTLQNIQYLADNGLLNELKLEKSTPEDKNDLDDFLTTKLIDSAMKGVKGVQFLYAENEAVDFFVSKKRYIQITEKDCKRFAAENDLYFYLFENILENKRGFYIYFQ